MRLVSIKMIVYESKKILYKSVTFILLPDVL